MCSLAAAAALGGAGVEDEAPGAAVYAVPAAPASLARVSQSSNFLKICSTPGGHRLGSFFEAILSQIGTQLGRIRRWFAKADHDVFLELEEDRRLQQAAIAYPCRPSRRPGEYGVIPDIPTQWFLECIRVPSEDIFHVNHQIVDISFGKFGGLEALLIAQRRGPVQYIEVVTQGDYAHYEINRVPLKTFRDHSCLNREMWCFVSQVQPIDAGFLVVDRHRVIHYNYTWLAEGSIAASEIPEIYVSQFGMMNADQEGVAENEKLKYPNAVAEYVPYNMTHVSMTDDALAGGDRIGAFEITSLIPHAWCRLIFVTDTGNHRVMILNASNVGQFDYIGQYGHTGEATSNETGFDWPWGIAVSSPAWEGRYEPAYAHVFVVDRRNHRLVKLNLGYPLIPCEYDASYQVGPIHYDYDVNSWMCRRFDKPRLSFSAEYGRSTDTYNRPRGLSDPTAVGIYRHFVLVCEVEGNAVTMLRVNHQPPYDMKFVTYFKPTQGVSLQGNMAVSPFGYVWYNYVGPDMKFYLSSMYLPEILRESKAPSRFKDFLEVCVNISWYQELMNDPEKYINHVGFILNASVINWIYPDEPGYLDIFTFNKSGAFDIDGLNSIVYNGTMQMCEAPTTPTPPPFFGGNEEGWVIDGKSQSEFTKRSGTLRSSHIGVALVTCSVSALLLHVLS